jgi:hypothetical protein
MIFVDFRRIFRENLTFIKIWQEWRALYMKIMYTEDNISLKSTQIEKCFRQNLQTKSRHIICSVTFSRIYRLWDNVEKYGRARQATYESIIQQIRFACCVTEFTHTHRMCNAYCFSTATTVTRTRFSVTFIRTLPVLSLKLKRAIR